MNILSRAIKNLMYRKIKYMFICTTMSIIGVFLIISINMEESAKSVKYTTLESINPIGLLYNDPLRHYSNNYHNDYPNALHIESVSEIAASKYVKSATIFYESQSAFHVGNDVPGKITFWAHGNSNIVELSKGIFEMEEGRFLSESDLLTNKRNVVIERRLAEQNNLKLGDKISLSYYTKNKYEFEIIGIYRNNKNIISQLEEMSSSNLIHIPYGVFAKDRNLGDFPTISRSTFELWSGLDIEDFMIFVDKFLVNTNQIIDVDMNYLIRVMKPLDVIIGIAKLNKYLAIATMILILTVLSILIVKEREYEIGTLLAIGESKKNVIAQLLTELSILAFISVAIAFPIGSWIANENSKIILEKQMEFFQEKEGKLSYSGSSFNYEEYLPVINRDEMLSNYKIVSIDYIDDVLFYYLAISFVSGVITSTTIFNKTPKFLLERRQ